MEVKRTSEMTKLPSTTSQIIMQPQNKFLGQHHNHLTIRPITRESTLPFLPHTISIYCRIHFLSPPIHSTSLKTATPLHNSILFRTKNKRERETYLVSIEEKRKEEKPRAAKNFLFCPRAEGRNQETTA